MNSKSIGETHGCPLTFVHLREHHASKPCWGSSTPYTSFLSRRLDMAQNLYRRDLFAHFGCVNAIEFSNEGYLLISGGDDRRVLLWNLELSMSSNCKPTAMKEEHSSNIFCLAFDSSNSKIFSAGNDEQVIVHDIQTLETVNVFMHQEAIYGVSVNPYVDSVFASAGEDGQILIFDIRAPASADPFQLVRSYHAFHAVQFHPVEPVFIVTANSKEGVILWDVRKPRVPVIKYGEKRSSESSMCARFNSSGSQIVALRRRMHPVLYNTHQSAAVCEFDADHYYNSCTMKSCCFAGSRDQFVLSGSDDFNLYMWRIPDPHSDDTFIGDAHLILKGHRSIVNQVRFSSSNFTIASSGVEKIVKLWSPIPFPGSYGTLSGEKNESCMNRRVYTHEDYIGLVLDSGQTVSHDYSHGSTEEDPKMMAFFDSLVQREVEGCTTNTDLSDDDLDSAPSNPGSIPTQSSSSLLTSQSDDSDSDSAWASPLATSFSLRRRYPLSPRIAAIRHRSDTGGGSPARRPKPAQGSEWILRLIAKKRAQLKAAKKKKRSVRKQKKSKARQFIQCFTTSRQYLYRPENNRSGSSARPRDLTATTDLVRRRRSVAPYTMISFETFRSSEDGFGIFRPSEDEDSDDDDDEGTPVGDLEDSSSSEKREGSNTKVLSQRTLPLWSSDSSSSDDETKRRVGKTDISNRRRSSHSDEDVEDRRAHSHDASNIAENHGATSISPLRGSAFSAVGRVRHTQGRAIFGARGGDDESSDEQSTPHSTSAQEGLMVPISGVSTNEQGSVLFDLTSPTSLESPTFDLLNRVECQGSSRDKRFNSNSSYSSNSNRARRSRVSFPKQDTASGSRVPSQNGCHPLRNAVTLCGRIYDDDDNLPTTPEGSGTSSPQGNPGTTNGTTSDAGSANTPDSGISSAGDNRGVAEESGGDSASSVAPFKRKRIPEFRLKSYRSRVSDEEED